MNRFVTSIQEGQRVFFESHRYPGTITSGIVRNIQVESTADGNMKRVLTIDIPPRECIQQNAYDVFLDKISCELYLTLQQRERAKTNAYMSSITDVKSLVNFMFTHDNESDSAARAAALQRAQDLLGCSKEELTGPIQC